jgi:hypothetical protein
MNVKTSLCNLNQFPLQKKYHVAEPEKNAYSKKNAIWNLWCITEPGKNACTLGKCLSEKYGV